MSMFKLKFTVTIQELQELHDAYMDHKKAIAFSSATSSKAICYPADQSSIAYTSA